MIRERKLGPFEFIYSLKCSRMQPDYYNLNTAVTHWTWLCSVFYYCSTALEIFCPVSMRRHIFSPRRHMIRYLDYVFFSVPCVEQAFNYLKLCELEVTFLGIGIGYSRCLCPWSICDLELDHWIICCGWLWPWRTLLCCVHLRILVQQDNSNSALFRSYRAEMWMENQLRL